MAGHHREPKDEDVELEATPTLIELTTLYHGYRRLVDSYKAKMEDIKTDIVATLEESEATAVVNDGIVLASYRAISSSRIDVKKLRVEEPELAARFSVDSFTRRFEV